MRIISGNLGGRQFEAPHGHRTHPMSEKVRGGLFNVLGDIGGLTVLDAFAGSGALSYEAISRGATLVQAIDSDKNAQRTIQENLTTLGLEGKIKLVKANASTWSDNNPTLQFDLVLLDSPYDDVRETLLSKLANHTKLSGTVVLSLPPTINYQLSTTHYQLLTSKDYGDSQLVFYRRIA